MKSKILFGMLFYCTSALTFFSCAQSTYSKVVGKVATVESYPNPPLAIKIENAEILTDTLCITVLVNSKFDVGNLVLLTNERYKESLPPQLTIVLNSDKSIPLNGKQKSRKVYYPLQSLKYGKQKKLILNLKNYSNKIEYNY